TMNKRTNKNGTNKNGKPKASDWTFGDYLEQRYIPSRVSAGKLTAAKAQQHRALAKQLDRFVGGPAHCWGINRELAARFAVWLVERHGLSASTAERRSQEIVSIVTDWQETCGATPSNQRRKPLSDNPNTSRWTVRTYL